MFRSSMFSVAALSCILMSFFVAFSGSFAAEQFRPVVLMHGVSVDASSLSELVAWIQETYPTMYVKNVEIGNGKIDSIFLTMNDQVERFCKTVLSDPKLSHGFNLIGFSQGTLIARGYIERCNQYPVYNFISLAGPQAGQFGVPKYNIKLVDLLLGEVPYGKYVQDHISVGGYWKDPYALKEYLEKSSFLADINNERATKNDQYKKNFMSLNKLVLIYSENDDVIVPRESGWFSFYAPGTQSRLIPMRDSDMYKQDWIGLQYLDKQKRIDFFSTTCLHGEHVQSTCRNFFEQHTVPYLNNTISV